MALKSMNFDLRLLRYFVTVAAEQNFNRAAEKLHIAQPPLSRAIQQLEAECGAPLLDRSTRPLQLTPVGRIFYEQALNVLARVESMQTVVRNAALSAERKRYVMGFVASTIYARLPELIRAYRIAAPEVEIVLVEISTLDQIAALKEERIDVGFGRIRLEEPSVKRIVLRHEKLVTAVPARSPLANKKGPLTLKEVGQEALILYPSTPRPSYADQVLSLFRDNGIEPHIAHEARELQIAIGLVAAEEGLAIVPESISRSRTHDVVYLPLAEQATSPIIMSIRKGDRSETNRLMADIIASNYQEWGYEVPAGLSEIASRGSVH